MAVRKAQADWKGGLKDGSGVMKFPGYTGPFTWSSRFEEAAGTNPESLLGAAHAGCYTMALSGDLGKAGFPPTSVSTEATVTLGRIDGKARILNIHLETEAVVPGINEEQFQQIAEGTRTGCPVSVALAAVEITLSAKLVN
jgi:osmotically inducible protein OsmC